MGRGGPQHRHRPAGHERQPGGRRARPAGRPKGGDRAVTHRARWTSRKHPRERPAPPAAAPGADSPDAAEPAVRVTDLTVVSTTGGHPLLDAGSLTVRPGRVVALTGPSGAGKTTLLRAVCGALPPGTERAGGEVEVLGRPVLRLTERELRALRRHHVAYVGQDPGSRLNPRMRVRSLLRETAARPGPDTVERLLAEVRLPVDEGLADRRPGALSGGQQRRVALARALAREPVVLLLDEPTAGLHPALRDEVGDLLRHLATEHRLAIALSCHDADLVSRLADEVVELRPAARPSSTVAPYAPGTALPARRPAPSADAPARPPAPTEATVPSVAPATAAPATPVAPAPALLTVRDLGAVVGPRRARRTVLRGVGLALPAGGSIGIVGVSGSGKTTLARAVVGLHKPTAGAVALRGTPLAASVHGRSRDQRRRMQLVPQDPLGALNPSVTAGAAIARPLRLHHRTGGADARARVAELLEQVALPADFADRYPHELSGGQRQRVSIARALAARPDVLVCDEVTSALDGETATAIMDLLVALRERHGLALALISHDLRLIGDRTDTVLVLDAGRAVEAGPTERVFRAPEHAVTQALLAGRLPAVGPASVA
ncbi:ABC transporter ATP-binding protein [Streptomyces sp. AC536]|nr:ABC transporter ATP-binding protein [Streptomyces buecherae]QNJ44702.1 ABC transporter ATP-binding protein [Streptomyces buecherae]